MTSDTDAWGAQKLQFVADALASSANTTVNALGRPSILNGDGSVMSQAQIATASGLTLTQVQDLAGRANIERGT